MSQCYIDFSHLQSVCAERLHKHSTAITCVELVTLVSDDVQLKFHEWMKMWISTHLLS